MEYAGEAVQQAARTAVCSMPRVASQFRELVFEVAAHALVALHDRRDLPRDLRHPVLRERVREHDRLVAQHQQRYDGDRREDARAAAHHGRDPRAVPWRPLQLLAGALLQNEEHVDEHGEHDEQRQRNKREPDGVVAAQNERAVEQEVAGREDAGNDGRREPRDDDRHKAGAKGERVGRLAPHNRLRALPHQRKAHDCANARVRRRDCHLKIRRHRDPDPRRRQRAHHAIHVQLRELKKHFRVRDRRCNGRCYRHPERDCADELEDAGNDACLEKAERLRADRRTKCIRDVVSTDSPCKAEAHKYCHDHDPSVRRPVAVVERAHGCARGDRCRTRSGRLRESAVVSAALLAAHSRSREAAD
mmetsp:Transcript_4316/g.12444  ORF Transcript_4316/g.12444 Transcript_4316/m.12444 type:complete len:361 (-) Transcript_4316:411-1493(-)